MKGPAIVMTFALLVSGVIAVPLSGVAQPGDVVESTVDALRTPEIAENETKETPPGARLAAVVGAQRAEIRGEVDSRAFDTALERAASDGGKARVVVRQTEQLEERIADLEERKEDLHRAHRNGNLSTSTYVAELTELTARTESARGLANQSHTAARGLPDDVASRQGINVTAIGSLERRAANLTGPEVARIARSIAGPDVGRPVGAGPPDHAGPPNNESIGPPDTGSTGPPDDRGNGPANGSARSAEGLDNVTDRVASGNGNGSVENAQGGARKTADDAGEMANESADRDAGGGARLANESSGGAEDAGSAIERGGGRLVAAQERLADLDSTVSGVNATALRDAQSVMDAARTDLEAARTALDDGDVDEAHQLTEQAEDRVERAEALVDEAAGEA